MSRYYVLVSSKEWNANTDVKTLCSLILAKTLKEEDKYQIGLTKIFFRAGMLAFLESFRTRRLNELVTLVQKNVRRRIAYKQYQDSRRSTIRIQSWWKGILARQHVEGMRRQAAAIRIQRVARGWLVRKKYVELRQAVIRIQARKLGVVHPGQRLHAYSHPRTSSAKTSLGGEDDVSCTTVAMPLPRSVSTFTIVSQFSLIRHSAARHRCKAHLRQVIILQSQWRRKLAVRELRGLRTEAKSASKFKEISYQLENKVVELTQTLQRRTAENKELGSRVKSLEQQLSSWQGRHEEANTRAKSLEAELAKPMVPTSQFEKIMTAKAETDRKMQEAARRVADQERQVTRLTEELDQAAHDMEERQYTLDSAVARSMEDASTMVGLRSELATLKEQISRSNALHALTKNQREPPPSPTSNGLRSFENGGPDPRGPSTSRRRVRRHSTAGTGPQQHARTLSSDEIMAIKKGQANPRAVSVMYPQNGPLRPRDSNGLPTVSGSSADEIVRLLEDEEGLDDDVLQGLIHTLKIPAASLHNPPLAKEVIFPAHLISLVSNEMWKLGMIPESERFLANVMQAIQNYVIVSLPESDRADG